MSVRLQAEAGGQDERREWLTTYADMITLLLTFFVMMFGMSNVDRSRFEKAASSIRATLGQSSRPVQMRTGGAGPTATMGVEQEGLRSSVMSILRRSPESRFIQTRFSQKTIRITIPSSALFEPGKAKLTPQAGQTLDSVVKLLKTFPEYNVHIRGHTDSTPISSPQFPSNWELSAVRATTVLRYLFAKGIPAHRMTATGLADIDPVAPNTSAKNRALNRRVEFVLEKEK